MKSGIFFLTILMALFSCSEEDLDPIPPVQPPVYNPPVCMDDLPHHASFSIDSAAWADNTSMTVWAHMKYDTVLIIQYQSVGTFPWDPEIDYGGDGEWIYHTIQSEPDTIDFRQLDTSVINCAGRKEWIKSFSFSVPDLRNDFAYFIELETTYSERGVDKFDVQWWDISNN